MAKLRLPRKKDEPQEIVASPQQETEQVEVEQTQQEEQNTQQDSQEITYEPKKRIWEVDFLRGFMMLFVIWDHFMYDIDEFTNYNTKLFKWLEEVSFHYYRYEYLGVENSLRKITHDTFVSMFVLTSGISCSFSRNNGMRALKMVGFSVAFSLVMHLVVGKPVNFNVIHVVTLSVCIWAGLEWLLKKLKKDWQKAVFGWSMFAIIITVLIVGYQARAVGWENTSKIWFFLADHKNVPGYSEFTGVDYLNFFPDFGWFLLGVFLGQKLYKQKTTLFPSFNQKIVAPITFIGRYSIWVYFGHQVLMYGFLLIFKKTLNWL